MYNMETKYPELERMKQVTKDSQVIGQFLDNYLLKKYVLARVGDDNFLDPVIGLNIEKILADYFEIDLDKVEQEKQQILEEIRKS